MSFQLFHGPLRDIFFIYEDHFFPLHSMCGLSGGGGLESLDLIF